MDTKENWPGNKRVLDEGPNENINIPKEVCLGSGPSKGETSSGPQLGNVGLGVMGTTETMGNLGPVPRLANLGRVSTQKATTVPVTMTTQHSASKTAIPTTLPNGRNSTTIDEIQGQSVDLSNGIPGFLLHSTVLTSSDPG